MARTFGAGWRPVADISPLAVLGALRTIENRGAGEMARRAGPYGTR